MAHRWDLIQRVLSYLVFGIAVGDDTGAGDTALRASPGSTPLYPILMLVVSGRRVPQTSLPSYGCYRLMILSPVEAVVSARHQLDEGEKLDSPKAPGSADHHESSSLLVTSPDLSQLCSPLMLPSTQSGEAALHTAARYREFVG